MKRQIQISLFLLSFFCFSCQEDPKFIEPRTDYDFFPVKEGSYIVYAVDSIVYNDFSGDTEFYSYHIKEEIGKPLNTDENLYELNRYFRNSDSSSWRLLKRFSISIDRLEALRTEENITYTSLKFPLQPGQSWNGNQYNSLGSESFSVNKIIDSETFNGRRLDSLIEIEQYDSENLIERRSAREKYARGIGLVYRFREYIFTRTDGINTQNDVDSGLTYTMEFEDYYIPD